MKCKVCGDVVDHENFVDKVSKAMKENCMCFTCNLWRERLEELSKYPPHTIAIIDGTYYTIGDENDESYFRGFGGARFQIEFNDGHRVMSTNLWCGGNISPEWRDKFPDNARFENNLKWKKVGESICLIEDPNEKEDVLPF